MSRSVRISETRFGSESLLFSAPLLKVSIVLKESGEDFRLHFRGVICPHEAYILREEGVGVEEELLHSWQFMVLENVSFIALQS